MASLGGASSSDTDSTIVVMYKHQTGYNEQLRCNSKNLRIVLSSTIPILLDLVSDATQFSNPTSVDTDR